MMRIEASLIKRPEIKAEQEKSTSIYRWSLQQLIKHYAFDPQHLILSIHALTSVNHRRLAVVQKVERARDTERNLEAVRLGQTRARGGRLGRLCACVRVFVCL